MRPFEVWLPYFSSLLSHYPAPPIYASATLNVFLFLHVFPCLNISQTDPKEVSRIFCPHLPPFTYSTPYPYNPTPCSFDFPLTYTLYEAHSSLRINSFGTSLTQSAPLNFLCKHIPVTTWCVSWAPSGHSTVNLQDFRDGCWIPSLPSQKIDKVEICHFAR